MIAAGAIVVLLLGLGLSVTLANDTGSVGRQLGLALLSGAIVGGALVLVTALLEGAAGRRSAHEALLASLSSTDKLNGIDLAGRDLAGIYLPGRALVAARLKGANLEGAMLFYSDLRHADLKMANLAGADLGGSTLAGADLTGADLTGAILCDVDMTGATLVGCRLVGAVIEGSRLIDTNFRSSDFTRAVVRSSYLMGAAFLDAALGTARIEDNEHDETTTWPGGFDAPASCDVVQESVSNMDLASYLAHRTQLRVGEHSDGGVASGDGRS